MTLRELKDKWFVSEQSNDGLLGFRHPKNGQTAFNEQGSPLSLSRSTDGNKLTILGEGEAYMIEWVNLLRTSHTVLIKTGI